MTPFSFRISVLAVAALGAAAVMAAGATLGLAAMGLTMARPDELDRYRPVFDLNAAWMLALGLLAAGAGLRAGG